MFCNVALGAQTRPAPNVALRSPCSHGYQMFCGQSGLAHSLHTAQQGQPLPTYLRQNISSSAVNITTSPRKKNVGQPPRCIPFSLEVWKIRSENYGLRLPTNTDTVTAGVLGHPHPLPKRIYPRGGNGFATNGREILIHHNMKPTHYEPPRGLNRRFLRSKHKRVTTRTR